MQKPFFHTVSDRFHQNPYKHLWGQFYAISLVVMVPKNKCTGWYFLVYNIKKSCYLFAIKNQSESIKEHPVEELVHAPITFGKLSANFLLHQPDPYLLLTWIFCL